VTLYASEGAIWIRDGLALRNFTNEHFAGLGERYDRRGGAATFGVRNDDGFAAFEDRDD
jgi:hypothetical protein